MTMDAVIDKEYPDGYRVVISWDEWAENPRHDSDCFLGKIIMFSSRYNVGDELETDDPQQRLKDFEKEKAIILPVYLYDHSGITINTSGFHCPWDSGLAGVIVATRESIKEHMGWDRITKYRRMKIIDNLKGEIEELDNYLTGQMFYFHVYFGDEMIDSCHGFNGRECIEEEEGYMWTEHILPTIKYHREERFKNRLNKIKTLIKAKAPLQVRQHQMEMMP